MPVTDTARTECRRCGTCCRKGGPALHRQDRELVEKGLIAAKHLITFRQGEPVYDNVMDRVSPAPTDIIKIGGPGGSQRCFFLAPASPQCGIYAHRPLECRVLKCWDTGAIERLYDQERLTRKDLLGEIAGLWDLVAEHQARCNYDLIRVALKALDDPQPQAARNDLQERLGYDRHLRRLVIERRQLAPDMLDFVFGRPLEKTVRLLGWKLVKIDQGFRLVRWPSP